MRIKKITAAILAAAFIVPLFPAFDVYANLQNYVDALNIFNMSSNAPGAADYRVNLRFTYTTSSARDTRGDFYASGSGGMNDINRGDRDPARFEIMMQNVSKIGGEAARRVSATGNLPDSEGTEFNNNTVNMNEHNVADGSLYKFWVETWHEHTYFRWATDINGDQVKEPLPPAKVAVDPASAPQKEVLFLTDLTVSGEGVGKDLIVKWDNPKYNNNLNVFSGFNIYYVLNTGNITNIKTQALAAGNAPVRVAANDPRLRSYTSSETGRAMAEYRFTDDRLLPGRTYAVAVYPLVGDRELLESVASADVNRPRPTVNLGGNNTAEISASGREYRNYTVRVELPLFYSIVDFETIRLEWPKLEVPSDQSIREIIIEESTEPGFSSFTTRRLGTLTDPGAANVTFFTAPRPPKGETRYYRIIVKFNDRNNNYIVDGDLVSLVARYSADEVSVRPNKPDLEVKGRIYLQWSAFARPPFDESEEALAWSGGKTDGLFIDENVRYDIWISDRQADLLTDNPQVPKVLDGRRPSDGLRQVLMQDGRPGYANFGGNEFNRYAKWNGTGYDLTGSIDGNKTYYIRVDAYKTVDIPGWPGETELRSEPAYLTYYVPPAGEFARPPALSKPPLSVRTDDAGIREITQNSVNVQWKKSWYEILREWTEEDGEDNITYMEAWYTDVAVVNGELVYGPDILPEHRRIPIYDMAGPAAIISALKAAGLTEDVAEDRVRRVFMDTDGDASCEYQMKVFPFSELEAEMAQAGYNAEYRHYLEWLTNDEKFLTGADGWRTITPVGDPRGNDYLNYAVTNGNMFNILPNTTYVILMRGFRTLADGTRVGYPAYLIATTLPPEDDLLFDPTVPVLRLDGVTEISAAVYWIRQDLMRYELAVSDVLIDNPDNAEIRISADNIRDKGILLERNGEINIFYDIPGLFPDTGYYIWLRAIGTTDNMSVWSNPVFAKTLDIDAPHYPYGLGLASQDFLARVNLAEETEYTPKGPEHLILTWLKDENDASSVFDINALTGDNATALTHEEIMDAFLVLVEGLSVNTPYYIRAKTALTITKPGDELVFEYNYVVQLTKDRRFREYIEIVIPPLSAAPENRRKFLRKESDFSPVVTIRTGTSDDEYDSFYDPNMVPLPPQDIEVNYDIATDTVTYRFLSGREDYYVDQRFISRMIATRAYHYGIDVSKYLNDTVTNRVVEIPYTIFRAFGERKMDFCVIADNMMITFTPGALDTAAVRALPGMGVNAKVVLELSADAPVPDIDDKTEPPNEMFASAPHTLNISVVTPEHAVNVDILAQNVDLSLRLPNRYTAMDFNVGAYMADRNSGGWQRVAADYSRETATLSISTNRARSAYAAIAKTLPYIEDIYDETTDAALNVTSKLNITDLKEYDPAQPVTADQANNLIAAVAKGDLSVAMNGALSNETVNSLTKSGMLISGGALREAVINSLVKLYELKTRSAVRDYPGMDGSPYADISQADAAYQTGMLKASYLGLYGNDTAARPKEAMKLSELLYILDIIMQDSGM